MARLLHPKPRAPAFEVAVGGVPVTVGSNARFGVELKNIGTGVQVASGRGVLNGDGVGRNVFVGSGVFELAGVDVTMAVCVSKKFATIVPTENVRMISSSLNVSPEVSAPQEESNIAIDKKTASLGINFMLFLSG
jgi:hypothetical protein